MKPVAVLIVLLAVSHASISAQGSRSVQIEMSEFAFRPAIIHLQAGESVRLLLVNRGQLAHQFETGYLRTVSTTVVGAGIRIDAPGLEFARLDPGAALTVAFVPQRKGRFSFACTIEGHREAGMVGIIDVR